MADRPNPPVVPPAAARPGAGADPLDPDDMFGAVRALPEQVAAAWSRVAALSLPPAYRTPPTVVVAGMGGSAIAADVAGGALGNSMRIQVVVHRDAALPAWVDDRTLVIASSFSGDTAETLAAWDDAAARGCRRIALTGGGRLMASASEAGAPIVRLQPGGQPRAAFGQSLAGILGILHAAAIIDDPGADIAAAVDGMRDLVDADAGADADPEPADVGAGRPGPPEPSSTDPDPPAVSGIALPSSVAHALSGRLPILFAAPGLEAIGRRWRGQLSENAKLCAILEVLPEAHHNAVEGLPGLLRHGLSPIGILLGGGPGPRSDGARDDERIEATQALLGALGIPAVRLAPPPGLAGALAGPLWLVQHADLTSLHLARLEQVDPTPIPTIQQLKRLME